MINKTFPIMEKLLNTGLQLSQDLHRQLQEETAILKNSRPEASLDEATQQKQQLIGELNELSRQLGQVLETEKLPNNRNGINAYFEKAAGAGFDIDHAVEKWERIIDVTATNKTLNECNGVSINLLLRHTRQSLNILKGKPQTGHTYGPDGSTNSDLHSNTSISV
ncbi:MAG: flagella synthesis protein FlgN [Gammaproteobacteria bacterium]